MTATTKTTLLVLLEEQWRLLAHGAAMTPHAINRVIEINTVVRAHISHQEVEK